MKRKLAKALSLIVIVSTMLMGLAACGKSECYFCGEEKSCKTYDNALLGEIDVCKDCKSEIEDIKSELEDIFK